MRRPAPPRVIKKYGNRRLYDTVESRYVTLDELAACVRAGNDVRVVDARDDGDITQATLAQIILEGRGAAQFLSVPILTQLVRMNDDALADFMSRYVSAALALYQQTRQGVQGLGPLAPFAVPYAASGALARMVAGIAPWGHHQAYAPRAGEFEPDLDAPLAPQPAAPEAEDPAAGLDALRKKLDALERAVKAQGAASAAGAKKKPAAKKKTTARKG
ncbi:MAG: polyhydroxyalkanoate synthesis regulator DNA-binding domain-containing protein [Polyangiales bacterium]